MSHEETAVALEIEQLRLDGGTQVREKIDQALVEEYAEQMREGAQFPPVVVVHDGERYWLADGFHRLHAAKSLGRASLECRVFDGSRRDAVLVALRSNSTHGLRRSNADKRRAVELVLADDEWSRKSNRWIASVCGVGHHLVEIVRNQLGAAPNHPTDGVSQFVLRVGQDGRQRAAQRAPSATTSDAVDEALRSAESFDACLIRLKRLAADGEKLARGPGGKYLTGVRLEDYQAKLRQAADHLAATMPATRCGECRGAGCECCAEHGWLCADCFSGTI